MSLYKNRFIEKKVIENGIGVQFEPNEDGTVPTIYIAPSGSSNRNHTKALAEVYLENFDTIENKSMTEEQDLRLGIESFVKGCVKGWENVTDFDGNVFEFSQENAIKLFEDLPSVYVECKNFADNRENFLKSKLDLVAKN